MAKFNRTGTRPATTSPVRTETTPSGTTHEGGAGYGRDLRSELFLLAVTNMVGERSFYETAARRDDRYTNLVGQAAVQDPEWCARLLGWLRREANMRSAALVGAAEFTAARLAAEQPGRSRQVVAAACQRADEPGELLAYWISRYGRALPMPVKRGVADAAVRLYDERSLLKWDSPERSVRFAGVLKLTHPHPRAPWQDDLFGHILARRTDGEIEPADQLAVLRARARLTAIAPSERREVLRAWGVNAPERLREAGATWEFLAGWLQGPMNAEAWSAVIPSMGYMALLRNLRNFDRVGITDDEAERIGARLADPEQVARSRQLPMRFLSAYRAAPSLRWGHALETALGHSLANVPRLGGRTLVLVDQSGSMCDRLSARSDLTRAAAAAVFGSAVAMRCDRANLVQFGTDSQPVPFEGVPLLRVVDRFRSMGGTNTADAVRRHYTGHDRVVIVSDEQAWGGYGGSDPTAAVPERVPVYTYNLVGYEHGHGPSGSGTRVTIGGLSDAAFRVIPLLESGRSADWPF